MLCVYGNRQNLGIIRKDENALWSLGVHDLSVILYLLDEEPSEAWAHGNAFLTPGVEDVVFCYLRFPSGRIAHMHLSWLDPHKMRRITVVGRDKMVVFDDMELERKITVYEKAPWQPAQTYGEWQTRTGDIYSPKIANDEPLKLECQHFLALVAGKATAARSRATGSRSSARSSSCSTRSRPFLHELRARRERRRLPRDGDRRRLQDRRQRRRRQAADALAALDREARAAAARSSSGRGRSSRPARSSSPARSSARA